MKERFTMQKDGVEDVMIDNESCIIYRCCDMALKDCTSLLNDYEQKNKRLRTRTSRRNEGTSKNNTACR